MRPLNRSFLILVCAALVAAASGGIAVIETRSEYYGVCSKLSGFPGILQRTGLLQSGTCRTLPGGSLCSAGSACTVENKAGICKNTGRPGQSPTCSCVPTTLGEIE